jgi:hypothetical protein
MNSIKTWLSAKDDWLLIIDNADDRKVDVSKFFPAGNRGSIVFTTRLPDYQQYGTVGFCQVDKMDPEDAITLLLRRSGVSDIRDMERRALAADIVEVLGYLALAIIQAEAVCNKRFAA